MTFAVPRRLGAATFALGLLTVLAGWPATAENGGRTWTDPPPREAAEAKPETPKSPAASGPAAAESRPTVAAAPRPAKASATRSAPRRVAARPATPRRPVQAALPHKRPPTIRTVTMRSAAPAPLPASRYGYVVEAAQDRPGTFVGGRMFEEDRALRIRRAQEAGYIVVRSRSVEFPDGRRLRTYRPLAEEAED